MQVTIEKLYLLNSNVTSLGSHDQDVPPGLLAAFQEATHSTSNVRGLLCSSYDSECYSVYMTLL